MAFSPKWLKRASSDTTTGQISDQSFLENCHSWYGFDTKHETSL